MTESTRQVVDRWVAGMNSGDIDASVAALHEDVVEVYPQSGEEFRGRESIRALLRNFESRGGLAPEVHRVVGSEDSWIMSPSFTLIRAAGSGDEYTIAGRVRYPNGEEWHLIELIRMRDGLIGQLTSYFAAPFEAPEWRAPYRSGTAAIRGSAGTAGSGGAES